MPAANVAYRITCDVKACGAEIDSGPGQPVLSAKRATYCPRCQVHIDSVEKEIAKEANRRGFALVDELDALRKKMLDEALPAQKGGTGFAPQWVIEEAR